MRRTIAVLLLFSLLCSSLALAGKKRRPSSSHAPARKTTTHKTSSHTGTSTVRSYTRKDGTKVNTHTKKNHRKVGH